MTFHFKRLGKLLRKSRIEAGFSQSEVAKKFKFEQQFVSNWERGVSSPPMRTLKAVAKFYGLPLTVVHEALLEDSIERVKKDLAKVFRKI